MRTSEADAEGVHTQESEPRVDPAARRMHRIGTVRRQQGISLRRVVQQLKTDVRRVREEEDESSDLPLSRVYAWQEVLDVPVVDLLVESNSPLSAPVLERARMIRVMKTVAAILEKCEDISIRRMAENLAQQLVEIMPELQGVSPWHSVGHRRSLEDYGRVVERLYSEDVWREP